MTGSNADEEELDRMQEKILAAMADPETAQRVPDWKTPYDLTRIGLGDGPGAGPLRPGVYEGGALWAVRWAEEGHKPVIRECPAGESAAREFHASLERVYIERERVDRPELLTAKIVWQQAN